jgi:hypothetical protein
MSTLNFTSIPTKILAESLTAAATSFKLNNITGWDGNALTSADFGSIGYGVFRNSTNTQLEIFEWDTSTIASTSITINKRGLKFDGNVSTEITANKLAWTKGDTFVDLGTDTPQMLQYIQNYVDAAIVAGGVPATTSVLGLVKMSIAPASPTSPIAVGDNDTRVPTTAQAAALAGYPGTPSSTNKFMTQSMSVTAGATINGATTPVPVYQDTSTGKYLPCIANDTTKLKFQGFATSTSTDTNPINVQFDSIVPGFTGLTRGVKYYLADSSGVISATPGTYEVYLGIAVSTTELLIMKGRMRASGVTSFSTSTTSTITTGFKPSKIRIHAIITPAAITFLPFRSDGGWVAPSSNACTYVDFSSGSGNYTAANTSAFAWYISKNANNPDYHRGTITTITDNGFTLSNTKSGSLNDVYLYWEAEGEF